MDEMIFQHEEQVLQEKLEKFRTELEDNQLLLEGLPDMYRSQPDLLAEMLYRTKQWGQRVARGLSQPYFARIDFRAEDTGAEEQCYLGKIGVADERQQLVTVDWRAPIASLYYDSNLGKAAYTAPQGEIAGELLLKRQYDIQNGKLLSYNDVETVTNDDLLKPYLSAGGDTRLKNIVATIQSEQNRIIRERIGQNLIVQGVAGSGKTTVALHRIAYLVYNHRDTIKPSQYMVIGPNRFFISYISSVLPDLDVDNVPDHTFESLCAEYIGESYTLASSAQRLAQIMGGADGAADRLRTTMLYRDALGRFMEEFIAQAVPGKDLLVRGFPVVRQEEVLSTYRQVDTKLNITLQQRVNQCILYLSSHIENHQELFRSRLDAFMLEQAKAGGDLEKRRRDREAIVKELESGCRKALKKHFAVTETKILRLYELFLAGCSRYLPKDCPEIEQLQGYTLSQVKKRLLDVTDLPALIYLRLRMKGPEEYRQFRHAVVDEAQDFGEFHFYVLRSLLCESTFTIVGDMAQSIYHYRSANSWEDVGEQAFAGRAKLVELRKSYRTTVEIMQAANRVSMLLGLGEAVPVIRHGEPVNLFQVQAKTRAAKLADLVRTCQREGLGTIAVICKADKEAEEMSRELAELGVEAENVTADAQRYTGGVCTVPAHLAKGLEFDGVILADAGEGVYRPDSRVDMHLLYVAMTRALHKLVILYTGSVTKPLKDLPQA